MFWWSFLVQVAGGGGGGIVKSDDSPRQTESRTQRRRSASFKCLVFGLVRDRSVPEGRAPLVTLAESNSAPLPLPPKYITCPVYNGRETRVAADCIESSGQDARRHLGMKQVAPSASYVRDLNYAHILYGPLWIARYICRLIRPTDPALSADIIVHRSQRIDATSRVRDMLDSWTRDIVLDRVARHNARPMFPTSV